MTATQSLSAPVGRRYRFSIIRILVCGILLSVLVTACLYLKYSVFDFVHARLLDQESKTSAWILLQVSYALPWIFVCIFHGLVYCKHDRHDSIVQREMFWEVLFVTVFTYLILLPYLCHISDAMYASALEMGADIPQTDGKVDQTFIMIFHEWFIRLSVPLCALLLFHAIRAKRERLHPETEAAEPLMTKAEYDARKIAALAEAEAEAEEAMNASETAEDPDSPKKTDTEVSHHE